MKKQSRSTILALIICFLITLRVSGQQEEQYPRDGWAYSYFDYNPELRLCGGNFAAAGMGFSVTLGHLSGEIEYKNFSAEAGISADYCIFPQKALDVSLRSGLTLGWPLYAGLAYNHYFNTEGLSQNSFEAALAYSLRTPYTSRIAFWRAEVAYRIPFGGKTTVADDFPFRIRLIMGISLRGNK